MRYGPRFRETVTLSDGTRVLVRPVRAQDEPAIREAYASLSPTSRFFRFLGPAPALSEDVVRYVSRADGKDHLVLVAIRVSLDLKTESLVGGASFVRLAEEPDVAEISVTVVDDAQNNGLGRALLRILRDAALERRIARFRADVHEDNGPMLHLLEQAGIAARESAAGVLVFDVPILPAGESAEREAKFFDLLAMGAADRLARVIARLRAGEEDRATSSFFRGTEPPTNDDLP